MVWNHQIMEKGVETFINTEETRKTSKNVGIECRGDKGQCSFHLSSVQTSGFLSNNGEGGGSAFTVTPD